MRGLWAWLRRHPLLAAALLPALAALYVLALVPATPRIADIRQARSQQPSVVISADGRELAVFQRANRDWVPLADISPNVIAALVATEDRRFFEHRGVDPRRMAAAAFHSLRGRVQGGSTITQQLARNLYPDEVGRAPTIARKIKEAITALKIESVYGKQEILETYLNTVPFLYNAYGIEMAARTYFDKPARELDVLESATLIGMLKGTSYYNPVTNPQRALQRRNTVMLQMVRDGKLGQTQFESLKDRPLALDFERQSPPLGPAPHVAQQLRRWLIDWADRNGYDIHADGLVVRTTIDSRLQDMANQAVARQGDKLQAIADATWGRALAPANRERIRALLRETARYQEAVGTGLGDEQALRKLLADSAFLDDFWRAKTRLQAGFLALDPNNGHVRAWVGSRSFEQEKFDHVQQARRQPGSTFKPFVYGAAFAQGIGPAEQLVDRPVEIRIDERTVWRPTDVGAPTGRAMTLREGLIRSRNTITAQLMERVGPARVAQLAYAMGVRHSRLDPVPSLALGTSPVSLKEMVSAFGSIANGGQYVEPVLVTQVENRQGRVLEAFRPKAPESALSVTAAQTLLDVMRGVIDQGTGVGIRSRFGIQADVAGKTGTTQDNTDGWFIMMHPQLVAGARVGFNDNRITMRGDWGQGARNALNIVGDFFQHALKSDLVDAKRRFAAPVQAGMPDPWPAPENDWQGAIFQAPPQEAQAVPPAPWSESVPANEAPAMAPVPLVVETPAVPEARRAPVPELTGVAPGAPVEAPPSRPRAVRSIDGLPRLVIPPASPAAAQPVPQARLPLQSPQPLQPRQAVPWETMRAPEGVQPVPLPREPSPEDGGDDRP
ncbi:MAG: transglycosylase domain-containing protein [Ramlibacter sp.]|nr:transglycosylase domain-containing protein [Ramlibacter sp.]